MAQSSSLLCFSLCFLVFFHGCYAQIEQVTSKHEQQRRGVERFRTECQLQNINVLEHPNRKIKSEAGVTEIFDQNQEELQCAGVVVVRHRFEPRGLLLPSFNNAPQLMYIVQGSGIHGAQFPGCPETFQSSSSQQSQYHQRSQQSGDQHQKVRQFREGDVIALPAGVSHWIYNNGQSQLVLVSLVDQSNFANQLDQNYRKFFLGGNPQEEIQGTHEREMESQSRREQRCNNVFCGMDERTLADAFNIDTYLAKRLQSGNDNRGIIVRAKEDLEMIRPQRQQEEEEEEYERERSHGGRNICLQETFCTMRLKHNIADPKRADIYNPRAGRISTVNSYKLPILSFLKLSAEHGFLYKNGIYAPHWNINAHSIIYVTRGSARCQIVDNNGQQVFNGHLQEGQLLVVPQNFAVMKKATSEGFEWISFKTNENAKISQLAGRLSVTRAMPEEVLMNSFRISREEARRLKFNREEATLLQSSRSQSERE